MKRLYIVLLIVLGIIFILAVTLWLQYKKLNAYQLSPEEAMQVMEQFVAESDWSNGESMLQEKLYNLNNQVNAYLFVHKVAGNTTQYVIISASKTTPPILEYSANLPPAKSDPSLKGFYIAPNIVYEKSAFTLISKRIHMLPFLIPRLFEWNIEKRAQKYKPNWDYYLTVDS